MLFVERHEKRVVIKPAGGFLTESQIFFLRITPRVGKKPFSGQAQSCHAEMVIGRVVDAKFIEYRGRCQFGMAEPACIGKLCQINQQFIPGKSGRTHIG